ncbi:inhibin beta C chain-like isoform X2 [Nylanderia fulva]|uniref:inhibin beta C chain-like isoform X2 n=1 Tax=Nylanderia fulva TaxID=613905 RepID=UPI0010FB1264|nr:inhibin beta C chain-like isoform X2 [Nylanderia fulva]XP_029166184.1 inhibin beta C chain-like isoform X2 [Nylanderia fulva]
MRLLIIFVIFFASGNVANWSKMTNPLMKVWYTFLPHSESSTSNENDCAGCEQNKVNVIDPNPYLTELRVEYVKQQILKKLRLSKPPEVSMPLSTLPKPLINGNVLELRPGAPEPEKPAEHFYGKTDQVIVFPTEGVTDPTKYRPNSNHITSFHAAAGFTFYLPNEMLYVAVTSAELWFYKEQVENDDELKQTFVLSELDHWDLGGSFEKNTVMAIFETDIEGWVKTDIKFIVQKWINRHRLNHAIQITCTTCSTVQDTSPVSVEQTLKPFLVIHTAPLPQRNRLKRNSNCLPQMKDCCRDDLYINFRDIGWSDWILHPSGYHAYFCRGSCSTAASLTNSASPYNNVIRGLLTKDGIQQRSKIVPCCSPTQLAPLQMVYIDRNNTITQKTLPNMVVEACGCM